MAEVPTDRKTAPQKSVFNSVCTAATRTKFHKLIVCVLFVFELYSPFLKYIKAENSPKQRLMLPLLNVYSTELAEVVFQVLITSRLVAFDTFLLCLFRAKLTLCQDSLRVTRSRHSPAIVRLHYIKHLIFRAGLIQWENL